ncbi:MAG: toll/interleukin-1 receptor domain-containing protein [Anaerolineae bacterium]|nr:toll/interleukin-1 receptor domain-containing protein [Anaerolineae bacterium]
MNEIPIEVVNEDALSFDADVLALKYSRAYHGVAIAVNNTLTKNGHPGLSEVQPLAGEVVYVDPEGIIAAKQLLVVGTPRLREVDYMGIRELGYNFVAALQIAPEPVTHMAVTLHGAGYGLDTREAFRAELLGIAHAINDGEYPPTLKKITFIERRENRVDVMADELAIMLREHPAVQSAINILAPSVEMAARVEQTAARDEPLVFVSYARRDESTAMRIADDLIGRQFNVWIDQLRIRPGDRWDRTIQQALMTSTVMLLILTGESCCSDNVADEYHYFLQNKKTIVPVLSDDFKMEEMPYRLSRLQHIDFRDGYTDGLELLIEALRANIVGR